MQAPCVQAQTCTSVCTHLHVHVLIYMPNTYVPKYVVNTRICQRMLIQAHAHTSACSYKRMLMQYMHVLIQAHAHTSECALTPWARVHMLISTHTLTCRHAHALVCICILASICAHTGTHAHANFRCIAYMTHVGCMQMHLHTWTQVCRCTCIHGHRYADALAYMDTGMQMHLHTWTQVCRCTMHTWTHVCRCTGKHMHTWTQQMH